MIVIPAVEAELEHYENDLDVVLNIDNAAVILSLPSMAGLRELWNQFQDELRLGFFDLWSAPHRMVVESYGLLGFRPSKAEATKETAFGLAPITGTQAKGLARIRNKAAMAALIEAGIIARGEFGTERMHRPEGLAGFLAALDDRGQRLFFETLLKPACDLEALLRTNQGSKLGLASVEEALVSNNSAEAFLQWLGAEASSNAAIAMQTARRERELVKHLASIWFATYLARSGVWLLPSSLARLAPQAYPTWARPVQMWLSLPVGLRPFADQIMKDHLGQKSAGQSSLVVHVAIELAAASNVFLADGPRAGPFIGYKRQVLREEVGSPSQRSWAVNRIWHALLEHYGVAPDQHPDGHAFVLGKRLVSKGTRPFNWVHHPHPKNLRAYQSIYGVIPTEMPEWLRDWATHLEELLPLFRVEAIDQKIKPLNLWLLYLAGHPAPPRSFQEVTRIDHVDSRGDPSRHCFKSFLIKHFSAKSSNAMLAMTTLRQAWALSAQREGFDARLANPIQAGDSPFERRKHASRTTRRAMDARVLEIVARENLRDDMAFARGLGSKNPPCWRDVRHPETGVMTRVFFPAAPILVDFICRTGMRGMQGRWLDSGEGDEFRLALDSLTEVRSDSPLATPNRRESVLRLCTLMGEQRESVIGMWVNSGKSGPHEVPWIDERLIPAVQRLLDFQTFWYPITKPVPIESSDAGFDRKLKLPKGDAYPLMRDPINRMGHPISAQRIRNYWRPLLEHCQPIVDAELGYHYPLILADGTINFDIHSLRVSIITTLLDNGVPVTVVQMLVGHKSPIMTWYYQDVTNHKIHSALQAHLERLKGGLIDPHLLSDEDEFNLTSEAITFRTAEDFVGSEMLQLHRESGGFIDVFSHGICPGGICEKGGERLLEGKYKPVWRPRACSGCRFRVTGPAFLNGLVQRANTLMWEIKSSMMCEADLNLHIEEEEDAGKPVSHLRSAIRSEHDARDNLFNEWCMEIRTIKACEASLRDKANRTRFSSETAVSTGQDLLQMDTRFREAHEFELAQRITQDADLTNSQIDLPLGAVAYRDAALHRIAHANKISDYFYHLDRKSSKQALNLFGELLVEHCSDADHLEQVLEGSMLLSDMPELESALMSGFEEHGLGAPLLGPTG